MKFHYNTDTDRGEPVAYIDCDGDLIVKDENDDGVLFSSDHTDVLLDAGWEPHGRGVKHRFYKGDSVTITF